MSYIQATIGGKAVGAADQVTIDPALGCRYQCLGCYAKKSSQRGGHYDRVIRKDLDKKILQKSIRLAKAKGFQLGRVGKHCDPGDHIDNLNGILDCCNHEGFRCVVVSKSLRYRDDTAELLFVGKHVLHMSMGPYTQLAPSEASRLETAYEYKKKKVRTFIRLTRDITLPMSGFDADIVRCWKDSFIITPMRYPSKEMLASAGATKSFFEFKDGYYKPFLWHGDWARYMENVCGTINKTVYCCNCLCDMV